MSTYVVLKTITPAEIALANKALEAGLEEVRSIFNTSLPQLSKVYIGLESNKGLPLINALEQPLPQNVIDFFSQTLATGSGVDGTLLLVDVVGTPSGWVHTNALSNVTNTVVQLNNSGALDGLTNGTNGVYTVMENCANGDYTFPTFMANTYTTTIPPGLPGAGSYIANTANASIQEAFTSGLTPALVSEVSNIATANPTQASSADAEFNSMCVQIVTENTNLALASVSIANLTPNVQPTSLVTSLPQYGLQTEQGGAAYIMESIANISTIGGQAIIGTMREARNGAVLGTVGIQQNGLDTTEVQQPQATLSNSQYTVTQSVDQKIL